MATVEATATLTIPFTLTADRGQPTIIAVVDEQDGLVALSLTDDEANGSTALSVYRVEPSGAVVELRGSPVTLSDGLGLAFDYEAPFDVQVRYRVVSDAVPPDTAESNPVTVPSFDRDWLRSILYPSRSLPVEVVSFPEKASAGRVSLYQVQGRRLPVAVTDLMTAYTGQITLFAEGSGVEAVEAILSGGDPLLLHSPPEHGEDRFYFVVNAATIQRVGRVAQEAARYIVLDVAEIDSTRLTLGVPPQVLTWADVVTDYTDWQEVVDTFDSWRDLLLFGVEFPGA